MIWRVPLSFPPAWKQRQFCRVVQARPALFLCCETVFAGKAHATKMGLSISVGIHVRQAIWPIHLIFDAVPITRRHSRTGGNPVLNYSELFKDCRHFKLLDSRLCGNDGAWFSDLNLLQNHQIQPAGRTCSLSGNKYQRSSESVASTK